MFENISRVLLVASLLASSIAFGGHEQGNGGNAVVCRDSGGHILSAELLDFYEARELRQIQLDLEPSGADYKQRVGAKLAALGRLAPARAGLYQSWFDVFDKESLILHGVKFEPIDDSNHLFVPTGCAVEQLAVNRQPELPTDHRYLINGDLWDRLDAVSKAGLVLHELIYREMAALGETNSLSSRYLNGVIHSRQLPTLDRESFVLMLHDIGIPTGEWRGWIFDLKAQRPILQGQIYVATLAGAQEFTAYPTQGMMTVEGPIQFWPSGKVLSVMLVKGFRGYTNFFVPEWNRMVYAAGGNPVNFDEQGRVRFMYCNMYPDYRQTFSGPGYSATPTNPVESDTSPIPISFDQDGNVKSCLRCTGYLTLGGDRIDFDSDARSKVDDSLFHVWHYSSFAYAYPDFPKSVYNLLLAHDQEFHVQNQVLTFRQHTSISFWPTGAVWTGILAKPAALKRENGETVMVAAGMSISLDNRGYFDRINTSQE